MYKNVYFGGFGVRGWGVGVLLCEGVAAVGNMGVVGVGKGEAIGVGVAAGRRWEWERGGFGACRTAEE